MTYTRKAEDADFARAFAMLDEMHYRIDHPMLGPFISDLLPDPLEEAVTEAAYDSLHDWGEWFDGAEFLALLKAAGYKVVPDVD